MTLFFKVPPATTQAKIQTAPEGSITAAKKAKIAADKESTEAIAYFFKTWCGNQPDPFR
jgi:hypothetical protein